MSYAYREDVDYGTPFRQLVDWSWVWMGVLIVTKALDAVTTAVGLSMGPAFVEANPFAAAVFDGLGVGMGLLVLSAVTILAVGLVTEAGALYLTRHPESPDWGPTATRIVGYGPLSVVFAAAGIHNAGLIVRVLLVG